MTTAPTSTARDERWLWLLFAGAWCTHVYFSLIGWHHTLLNRLQFRQVQTAITTLFFPSGGFRLDYETPLFGPPWSIPLEFPLFQAAVTTLSSATGLALDPAGRLVSWLFFQLSLPAFYLLLGSVGVRRPLRLLGLSLLVTSPVYLYFSRAFLIESTVLCFAAWFLAAFARWLTTGRPGWLLAAAACGALAASVKLTTMAIFGGAAVLFAAGAWWSARSAGTRGGKILGRSAAAFVVPVAAGLAWLAYSTVVRSRNPEADIFNTVFGYWSFGDVTQRLSLDFWIRTISVWTNNIGSEAGLALGVYLFARARPALRPVVLGAFAAFLSGQLVFSNLYYIHDYYFYANGVFLLLALGVLLGAQFEDPGLPRWIRWGLPVLIILLQLGNYARIYLPAQRVNDQVPEYARVIHDLTRPDDTIVILGQDWDAAIPYYAQRRALMLRNGREADVAGIARSLTRLDPDKVGAVVVFGGFRSDSTFIFQAMSRLKLGPTPLLLNHTLQIGIWIPLSRRAEVTDKLPPHAYATLDLVPNRPPAGETFTLGMHDINQFPEFASLPQKPVRVTSMVGFSNTVVNNLTMLNAHAPCELVFRAPAGLQVISANFGIHDGAYTNAAGKTDGVEFVVVHRAPDGAERVLFSRFLDPAKEANDQGIQHLEVKLTQPLAGEILLRTLPGPHQNTSYDWAYVGQIELR